MRSMRRWTRASTVGVVVVAVVAVAALVAAFYSTSPASLMIALAESATSWLGHAVTQRRCAVMASLEYFGGQTRTRCTTNGVAVSCVIVERALGWRCGQGSRWDVERTEGDLVVVADCSGRNNASPRAGEPDGGFDHDVKG
jgi:hypothetical protein